MPSSSGSIAVFPLLTSVLGFRGDWFETYAPKLIHPAYLLMSLMLVIWVGIMALKRFEDANFEQKAWNIPVVVALVAFWPAMIVGMKELVDVFNTFLITEVFKIPWQGFGFPPMQSFTSVVAFPGEALARLLPNLSYWILYAFFVIFVFFYAVLGPFVLARGILGDEMDMFFGLVREVLTLFLWQTTLIIVVNFIMPDIVSGQPLPPHPPTNFYLLSIILGILILFVPSVTRKFARQIEGAIVPLGFQWGGAMLAINTVARTGGTLLAGAGVSQEAVSRTGDLAKRLGKVEEFRNRLTTRNEIQRLNMMKSELSERVQEGKEEEERIKEVKEPMFNLFKRAKSESEGRDE